MSQIGSQKRLITIFTTKLEQVVAKLKGENLLELSWDDSATKETLREISSRLEDGVTAIACATAKLEKQLGDYASILDKQRDCPNKEIEEYEEYAAKAESAIAKAFDLHILLQAQLQLSIRAREMQSTPATTEGIREERRSLTHVRPLELPTLPIPTFSGNLWEFENFWELYNNNIHWQDLPEMVKFNYLLSALKGQAREAIRRFQLSKGNYEKAVEFLLEKYSNKELLINQLVDRLDKCALRSQSIKYQRSLLEEIQVIITQMTQKGENIDSSWLTKRVLSKFPEKVMRKIIARKQSLNPDTSFKMKEVLQYLDDYISTEEMCSSYVGEKVTKPQNPRYAPSSKAPVSVPKNTAPGKCMCCQGAHPAFLCTVYTTPQLRSQYLRQNKLCLLCASSEHRTTQCKRRPCFYCKAAHHSSCCFSQQSSKSNDVQKKQENAEVAKKPKAHKAHKVNKAATPVNNHRVIKSIGEKANDIDAAVNTSHVINSSGHKPSNNDVVGDEAVLQLQAVLHTRGTVALSYQQGKSLFSIRKQIAYGRLTSYWTVGRKFRS